jgi:hypothetical protein
MLLTWRVHAETFRNTDIHRRAGGTFAGVSAANRTEKRFFALPMLQSSSHRCGEQISGTRNLLMDTEMPLSNVKLHLRQNPSECTLLSNFLTFVPESERHSEKAGCWLRSCSDRETQSPAPRDSHLGNLVSAANVRHVDQREQLWQASFDTYYDCAFEEMAGDQLIARCTTFAEITKFFCRSDRVGICGWRERPIDSAGREVILVAMFRISCRPLDSTRHASYT